MLRHVGILMPDRVATDDAGMTAVATASPTTRAPGSRATAALFGSTAFVASALIFVVEPLVARTMLPVLGGSASVWNSAMLTFQVLLLAGYFLAHVGATRLAPRTAPLAAVALAVAATVMLPVGLRTGWRPPAGTPVLWTTLAVSAGVAGPFLALACVSPTLQRWYASVNPGVDAYVLYAAGNVGSFIGLLAYPLVVERVLGIHAQRTAWTAGYVVFIVLFAACAAVARRAGGQAGPEAVAVPVERRRLVRWAAMSAGPSLLLLGVTRHLATDVAAIPLLWVVPLSIYLLTFVLAFSGRWRGVIATAGRLGLVLAAVVVVSLAASLPSVPGIVLHLGAFSLLVLAVHGRLADERPPVESLTAYYLALSAGGALGGVVGGLLAPVAFPGIYEYPLGILACLAWLVPRSAVGERGRPLALGALGVLLAAGAVLRVASADADGPPRAAQLVLGLAVVAALAASHTARRFTIAVAAVAAIAVALPSDGTLAQDRTYYGVSRVLENADGWHLLLSGTTVHGAQDPERPDVPLTYYAPGGPLHDTLAASDPGTARSIGVIGLGAGSMAAELDPGDELTYYEIDPAVIDFATDPDIFDFIAGSAGDVSIVEGDGRLSVDHLAPGTHDLLVVDAFSSDAIPVHLLTAEAVAGYERALTPDGLLVFHVSNRFFDLVPVVGRLAEDAGLEALVRVGIGDVVGSLQSTAVAVGTPAALARLAGEEGWRPATASGPVWTDDHADVLSVLRLG
jgi:SAM-dependent methyltransferase